MNYKNINRSRIALIFLTLVSFLLVRCEKDPEIWKPDQDELQIMEYIESDTLNRFNEFIEIAQKVGVDAILSTRGPFTLFLADDDAFKAYYESKGKSSFNDFTDEELTTIIRNHVVPAEISTTDVGLGALSEKNALGDYLVSEFRGTEIYINKYSRIIDRDISVANGIIHQVENVIEPIVKGTYTSLSELEQFSIFTAGLDKAGLKDTLDINDIPYGSTRARVRYTVLAVPDSVFKANGINSVDDLIAKYDDGNGNINETDNGFYEYMVYHCLERTHYLSDIEDGIYWVISRNNYVEFLVGKEFEISPDDSIFTTFIDEYSNIPTKNGVIHGITQLLPVRPATPKEFRWDTTSFPEFEENEWYGVGESVRNFYNGVDGFAKIKFQGDFLQYWCKFQGTGFINDDCLVMSEGYWTLEITLPRITRGEYEVYGYFKKGGNRANLIFYFDGEKVDKVIETNGSDGPYVDEYICDVNWTTTQEHVVKLVTVYPGIIMWDRLTFKPKE